MKQWLSFLSALTLLTVFLASVGYIAWALGQRWFPGRSSGIRWCATCIVFCWLLSILFSLLMSVGMFAPLPATMAACMGAVVTSRVRTKPTTCAHALADELRHFRGALAQHSNTARQVVLTGFLFLSALLTVRALALPLLGWDSLTYHGVKAGTWVQAGGWTTLNAPGGWEYYQSFFGGGELFTAWAMLFLHSDLLAGIPDVFFWGLVGLTTTCLAREFGMQARTALLVGMAFLCTMDLSRLVGSGYVDTCANAFLLGGILFLVRFARSKQSVDLCIAAAAFGLAASIKVNMLAVSLMMALSAIVFLLKFRSGSIQVCCFCLLAFAAPVAPWLLLNYVSTGYPLGHTPLTMGPIPLGVSPPNLTWFLDRPDLTPYQLAAETGAMLDALRTFGFGLLLTGMGIPGVLLGVGRCRSGHLLTVLLMTTVAGFYFSPAFSMVRLGWAEFNGRFLLPVVIVCAVAGLPVLQRLRHGTLLIEGVSMVSIMVGVWQFLQRFILGGHRIELLFLPLAALLTALVYGTLHRQRLTSSGRTTAATILWAAVVAGTLYGVAHFKDAFRIHAYSGCTTMHDYPRYWVDGLRALEPDRQPQRIAFTYGPQKVSHGSFVAPFLGGQLDRLVMYVSPDRDGFVVPHHPDDLAASHPSFASWIEALGHAGATHVLCLRPPCEELRWAQDHPALFVRLAGQVDDWGLFRIERPGP